MRTVFLIQPRYPYGSSVEILATVLCTGRAPSLTGEVVLQREFQLTGQIPRFRAVDVKLQGDVGSRSILGNISVHALCPIIVGIVVTCGSPIESLTTRINTTVGKFSLWNKYSALATTSIQGVVYQVSRSIGGTPGTQLSLSVLLEVDNKATEVIEEGGTDSSTIGSLAGKTTSHGEVGTGRNSESKPLTILVANDTISNLGTIGKDDLGSLLQVGAVDNDEFTSLRHRVVSTGNAGGGSTDDERINELVAFALIQHDGVTYGIVRLVDRGLAVELHPDVIIGHEGIIEIGLITIDVDSLHTSEAGTLDAEQLSETGKLHRTVLDIVVVDILQIDLVDFHL